MTAFIMGRAMWVQGITCPEKMTLVAIADTANDHGTGWLLIETLMQKTSLSKRTVQSSIGALCEKGLLQRRTRYNRSSVFKINIAALPKERPEPNPLELSQDDVWDEFRGAGAAPLEVAKPARGARDAQSCAGDAQHYAGDAQSYAAAAPIYPVLDPVKNPVLSVTPLPPEGEDEQRDIAIVDPKLSDDDLAELYQTAWTKLVELAPKLPAMRPLTADSKKILALRIDDHAKNRTRESVNDVLRKVFVTISTSRLLRGEKDNRDGTAWRPNAAWVLKKANFNKIMGDAYAADHVVGPDGFASGDTSIGATVADALRTVRASGAFAPRTAREVAGGSFRRSMRFE